MTSSSASTSLTYFASQGRSPPLHKAIDVPAVPLVGPNFAEAPYPARNRGCPLSQRQAGGHREPRTLRRPWVLQDPAHSHHGVVGNDHDRGACARACRDQQPLLAGGVVAATYRSCAREAGFFAQGFAFTCGQTRGCVPLDVSIDHEPRVRHVTISLSSPGPA